MNDSVDRPDPPIIEIEWDYHPGNMKLCDITITLHPERDLFGALDDLFEGVH